MNVISLSLILHLALLPLQEDKARQVRMLIGKLGSNRIDERDEAARKLERFGEAALPLLAQAIEDKDREVAARAFVIKARIEWRPYVPLWVEEGEPDIAIRLAGKDPKAAVTAYERIIEAGGLSMFLDRKVLRDGTQAVKRRVLARADWPGWLHATLKTIRTWEFRSEPLEESDFKRLIPSVVLSVEPQHRKPLEELARSNEPMVRLTGALGLAALGDVEGRKVALVELESAPGWRQIAAARAFQRNPAPQAEPLLRDLLRSKDAHVILAALDSLETRSALDLREDLVNLLSFRNRHVQSAALHLLVVRKHDERERILGLIKEGTFKYEPEPSKNGEFPGVSVRIHHRPGELSMPFRLGEALLLSDEPSLLDLIGRMGSGETWSDSWTAWGMREAISKRGAPPKITERIRSLACGEERASEEMASFARNYLREHPEVEIGTRAEAFLVLEREREKRRLENALKILGRPDRLSQVLRDRLLGIYRKWLPDEAHPLRERAVIALHRAGVKEATDLLVDWGRKEGHNSVYYLGIAREDERVLPILLEKLKSPLTNVRYIAAGRLAARKHDAAPPVILDLLRKGEYRVGGGGPGLLLTNYEDRDFTDELVPLLKAGVNGAIAEAIIVYFRWRGRKDTAELVRRYVAVDGVYGEAIRALQGWRDLDSYEALETAAKAPITSFHEWALLRAMARIDPERARPYLIRLFRDPDAGRRRNAYWAFHLVARPEDEALVTRVLQTEDIHRSGRLQGEAGRIGLKRTTETLLSLAEAGSDDAALGLAYLEERRAISILYEQKLVGSLDYLVHRSGYPDLTRRADLRGRAWAKRLPFKVAKERIKEAFGVQVALGEGITKLSLRFEGDETLPEFLDRNQVSGRTTHLFRNGRMEILPLEDAKEYWRAWWSEQKKEK